MLLKCRRAAYLKHISSIFIALLPSLPGRAKRSGLSRFSGTQTLTILWLSTNQLTWWTTTEGRYVPTRTPTSRNVGVRSVLGAFVIRVTWRKTRTRPPRLRYTTSFRKLLRLSRLLLRNRKQLTKPLSTTRASTRPCVATCSQKSTRSLARKRRSRFN